METGRPLIGVIGATGTIGGELVRLLTARGLPVRALTRDVAGREPGPHLEWREADLADADASAAALEGTRTLFLLTGNTDDMVRLQKNALAAAERAGLERVVKLSALGATDHSTSVIGLWHYNVERVLRESAFAWTILRPHHFMQNLLDPVVFDPQDGEVRSASAEGRIPFVDTRDVAAVAAEILAANGSEHQGETYTLTGPQALSYRDAAETLALVLDRPITYRVETPDEAWRRRRAARRPVWLVAAQLALAEYQRAGGPTERTTDTIERITGAAPRTLERFVADHAEALGG